MGWWPIDPETGKPITGYRSSTSPSGYACLNAVPGADDDVNAHYLGDCPWDMTWRTSTALKKVATELQALSDEEARRMFFERAIPKCIATEKIEHLLTLIEEMWQDIDWCYEDIWDRPAKPAEKRWVCENAITNLLRRNEE